MTQLERTIEQILSLTHCKDFRLDISDWALSNAISIVSETEGVLGESFFEGVASRTLESFQLKWSKVQLGVTREIRFAFAPNSKAGHCIYYEEHVFESTRKFDATVEDLIYGLRWLDSYFESANAVELSYMLQIAAASNIKCAVLENGLLRCQCSYAELGKVFSLDRYKLLRESQNTWNVYLRKLK
jgi:hypothetical protein